MSELRQRTIEEMQLRRYAAKTQDAYLTWISEITRYHHKSPDQISREEVRGWFLHLMNERKLSRSSVCPRCGNPLSRLHTLPPTARSPPSLTPVC